MPKRIALALAATAAIIVGLAVGFLELTIAGIIAAALTAALSLRERST